MKLFKTLIVIAAGVAALTDASAEITFKMAREGRDTVTNPKQYVVCITDPGNTATIDGQEVKVYKTGAFGAQVQLKEGDNKIPVKITRGNEVLEKEISLFFDKRAQDRWHPAMPAPQEQPCLFYVATLDWAFLQYGSGTDRLGGSKMGYLDRDIVLKVVGDIDNLYKVQLASNRYAYVQKEYVRPTNRISRTLNTNNMSMSNAGKRDRIVLSLPDRLPYASHTELDPTKIVVDVFGAMNNSNWITQRGELGMVEYVDAQQIDSDVFRLVIKLKEKYCWGYEVFYDHNSLVIEVKHSPETIALKGLKIGLDAGHGGPDSPGAISPTGINEKDVNLDIVYKLKKILEDKGATVVLSRKDDSSVSMVERKITFSGEDVDLMVSVHNNAGGSPLVPMGTSTYYKHITNRDLATALFARMKELNVPDYGVTGNFNFSLNAPTDYPNALVECLFMSSLPDEEMIADDAVRQKIAQKICLGIEDWLKAADAARGTNAKSKKK